MQDVASSTFGSYIAVTITVIEKSILLQACYPEWHLDLTPDDAMPANLSPAADVKPEPCSAPEPDEFQVASLPMDWVRQLLIAVGLPILVLKLARIRI